MPRPEAGERRATAEPVKYRRPQGQPVMYRSWAGPTTQQQPNLLQNLQRSWQQIQEGLRNGQTAPLNEALRQPFRMAAGVNPFMPTNPTMTPANPAIGQMAFARQGQAGNVVPQLQNQPQPRTRAQAAPLPLFTNGVYNGPGSMANMYAAQGREYDINASKWSSLRKQQAAYHSTLGQDTTQGAYYFGPGSAEQLYATAAYANAPISMPVVPVDYGGGYGYGGGGYGGGSSYVAPEPDIPRWLYGMLSWRYR